MHDGEKAIRVDTNTAGCRAFGAGPKKDSTLGGFERDCPKLTQLEEERVNG